MSLFISFSVKSAMITSCSPVILERLSANESVCQQSIRSSQDFRQGNDIRGYTVNIEQFFGTSSWQYLGGASGRTSGQSGTLSLPALTVPFRDLLLVFKGPNAHGIVGLLLTPQQLSKMMQSYAWQSPFLKKGKKPIFQDVSHISLYARISVQQPGPSDIEDVASPTVALFSMLLIAIGCHRVRSQSQARS